MDERYSTNRLLVLRKLTRVIADHLRGRLRDYLATLSHLLRPRSLLGDLVQGGPKEAVAGADKTFKQLQALYAEVARSRPFNLEDELKSPVEVFNSIVEPTPVEYNYEARAGGHSKSILVTSPLKWFLHYSGFAPMRLKDILADRVHLANEVSEFVIHALLMHLVVTRQAGVTRMLEGLRFVIQSARRPEFHNLPVPVIGCPLNTLRPPDEVLIESTELSGTDTFEEVVNLDDVVRLRDPFKDWLVQQARALGFELPA